MFRLVARHGSGVFLSVGLKYIREEEMWRERERMKGRESESPYYGFNYNRTSLQLKKIEIQRKAG